jgi:hypothetical protein
MEIALQLPEQKDQIIQDSMMHDQYTELCKATAKGGNVDKGYEIQDGLLLWKNRSFLLKKTREGIIKSEHNSKVA